MNGAPLFRCAECGGDVRLTPGIGREREILRRVKLPIPDDVEIPTCVECGDEYMSLEVSEPLDKALFEQLAARLKSRVEAIQHCWGVSERQVADALRVTRTHLARVLAGDERPSGLLFGMLDVMGNVPGAFAQAMGRPWDEYLLPDVRWIEPWSPEGEREITVRNGCVRWVFRHAYDTPPALATCLSSMVSLIVDYDFAGDIRSVKQSFLITPRSPRDVPFDYVNRMRRTSDRERKNWADRAHCGLKLPVGEASLFHLEYAPVRLDGELIGYEPVKIVQLAEAGKSVDVDLRTCNVARPLLLPLPLYDRVALGPGGRAFKVPFLPNARPAAPGRESAAWFRFPRCIRVDK